MRTSSLLVTFGLTAALLAASSEPGLGSPSNETDPLRPHTYKTYKNSEDSIVYCGKERAGMITLRQPHPANISPRELKNIEQVFTRNLERIMEVFEQAMNVTDNPEIVQAAVEEEIAKINRFKGVTTNIALTIMMPDVPFKEINKTTQGLGIIYSTPVEIGASCEYPKLAYDH